MTTTTAERLPVAILTADDILREAAEALREADRLRAAMRASENRLRTLCRQYGDAARIWGVAPHHLTQACKAKGLL